MPAHHCLAAGPARRTKSPCPRQAQGAARGEGRAVAQIKISQSPKKLRFTTRVKFVYHNRQSHGRLILFGVSQPCRLFPRLTACGFFEAAARRESFAKAAEELHVTSAAVAHHIKVLERHLGAAPDLSRASGFRLYKVVSQYIVACGVNHSGNRLRRKLTEMLSQASLNLHSASDPTRAT